MSFWIPTSKQGDRRSWYSVSGLMVSILIVAVLLVPLLSAVIQWVRALLR